MNELEKHLLNKLEKGDELTDSQQSQVLHAIMTNAAITETQPHVEDDDSEIRLIRYIPKLKIVPKLVGNAIDLSED